MSKFTYILFNKPYNVLCQFTCEEGQSCLKDFGLPKNVYPAGRLDKDSEGLLVLTDDGKFNQQITHPRFHKEKTYHVQVEGIPDSKALERLRRGGIKIQNYSTKPAKVKLISPEYPPRNPPIRVRKSVEDSWLELKISEGKNRQVRKMTAAVGHPTLRLIRVGIANYLNKDIPSGSWRAISPSDILP